MNRQHDSNEEALRVNLIGSDGTECLVLEGVLEMGEGRSPCRLAARVARLPWRRAPRLEFCSNLRLSQLKPFPDSIGSRVAHRAAELPQGHGSVSSCCGMFKKFPKAASIEKESFHFVGDPDTKGSAATACTPAVRAKDTSRSDGFLLKILLVIALEESVSIESVGVLAVWAGRAFEQREAFVALLLGSKNPDGHKEVAPHSTDKQLNQSAPTLWASRAGRGRGKGGVR